MKSKSTIIISVCFVAILIGFFLVKTKQQKETIATENVLQISEHESPKSTLQPKESPVTQTAKDQQSTQPVSKAEPEKTSAYSRYTQEELAALTGDERQGAVMEVIASFPEIERVAEVHDVSCDDTKCTVDFQSKTSNTDADFQTAVTHLLQKNPWIGPRMEFDPTKHTDGKMLRYVFTQAPQSKEAL